MSDSLWCFAWDEHEAHEYDAVIDGEPRDLHCPGYSAEPTEPSPAGADSPIDQAGTSGAENHTDGSKTNG